MLIRTRELLAEGVRHHEIRAQVRSGQLIRVRHGVYRRIEALAGGDADGIEQHLAKVAATMPGFGDGAVLSHQSAALMHGLPLPPRLIGAVHVTRPGHSGRVSGSVHLHRAQLPQEEVVVGEHGPMTSLAQTAVDLARVLPPVHAVALLDHALRLGAGQELLLELTDSRRNAGNVQARRLIRFADGLSESVGESHSRWLMHELGLPAPILQHKILTPKGEFVARSDFWWPECNVVGEFDGKVKYGRDLKPGQTIADVVLLEKQREEAIRRQGPWVIRWIWKDLDDRKGFAEFLSRALRLGKRAA
ncbi:hypothetical protein CGZ93_07770 [Enemella dayhoffiae]|uniref:AbiEi antitoxin N-terminal domain-containing protein n=1 Tax=Enemella dayhoffiae TaxID=2016507 RepID=A0A255H5E4_9ACTN|nr:type IV toxin-antitoxin system AbiEi family antitoxin domain-containing protein [Enemella dayhoffiae]OYO22423.1 hypothetical protein CGZ93_07770 [Enemella dayhoffiae]